MQTFLPYENFVSSARILDRQRLGKQRLECVQIAQVLVGETKGWFSHPVTRMWRGHGVMLCDFGFACVEEWYARGYTDNVCGDHLFRLKQIFEKANQYDRPEWLGGPIHEQYQALLKRKDPKYYSRYFPAVDDKLELRYPI